MAKHIGIPTLYRGVRFRSRTEARWAALFTALRWPWQYEPIDLVGYIPDFVIDWNRPLVVEVKGAASLEAAQELAAEKLEMSGWDGEALIVGSAPLELRSAHPILGRHAVREEGPDGLDWLWDNGRAFACLECGQASLLNCANSWRCRVCGEADGGHIGFLEMGDLWTNAVNELQWRAA